jgi:hypothetical protein
MKNAISFGGAPTGILPAHLGAGRRQVLRLVLQEGLVLALAGFGFGGTYCVGRTLKAILYEISAIDPSAKSGLRVMLVSLKVKTVVVLLLTISREMYSSSWNVSMADKPRDLVEGTLDMLILLQIG